MTTAVLASKADLDDQRWLDERVNALRDGIEAARDIWLNWTDNRNVSRLAGDQSYGDFIKSRLGYALPLTEVLQIMPGASTREIAKVAGVDHSTVVRNRGGADAPPDDQPATVLGADGKSYPARVVRTVEAEVIESEEVLNLDQITPEAVAQSSAVWLSDLRRYIARIVDVPAPPQVDPAFYSRLRREMVGALTETLDRLARDDRATRRTR